MIRGEIERSDYNLRQPSWQHCQQNKIYEGWSTALISTNSKAFLVSARKWLDLFKSWLNQLNWKAAFSKLRVDNLSSFFFIQVMRCPFSKPILPVRVWCSRKIKLLWTCGGIHYAVFWLLGGKWKQEQFFTCFSLFSASHCWTWHSWICLFGHLDLLALHVLTQNLAVPVLPPWDKTFQFPGMSCSIGVNVLLSGAGTPKGWRSFLTWAKVISSYACSIFQFSVFHLWTAVFDPEINEIIFFLSGGRITLKGC